MIKTLAKVGYAPIASTEDAPYSYSDIIYFKSKEAGGREVSSEPKGETTPIYADGVVVYTADENAGYDHKVQLIDIIDKIDRGEKQCRIILCIVIGIHRILISLIEAI